MRQLQQKQNLICGVLLLLIMQWLLVACNKTEAPEPVPPQQKAPAITALKLVPDISSLPKGRETLVQVMAVYDDDMSKDITAEVVWQFPDPSGLQLAEQNAQGQTLRAVAEGELEFSLAYEGFAQTLSWTVTAPELVAYRLSATSMALIAGDTYQASVYAIFSDDSEQRVSEGLLWSSDKPAIASVDAAGLVKAEAEGEAVIKVQVEQQELSLQLSVSTRLPESVSIKAANSMDVGQTQNLALEVKFAGEPAQTISEGVLWELSTSAGAQATLDGNVLSAKAAGELTLAARYLGVNAEPLKITISRALPESVTIKAANSMDVGQTQNLALEVKFAGEPVQTISEGVLWELTATAGAQATLDGNVLSAKAAGELTLAASYLGVSAEPLKISVRPAYITEIQLSLHDTPLQGQIVHKILPPPLLKAQVRWSDRPAEQIVLLQPEAIVLTSTTALVFQWDASRQGWSIAYEGLEKDLPVNDAVITAAAGDIKGQLSTVVRNVDKLSIRPPFMKVAPGSATQFSVDAAIGSHSIDVTSEVECISSDTAIATVAENCTLQIPVNAVAASSATVSATPKANGSLGAYTSLPSDTAKIEVADILLLGANNVEKTFNKLLVDEAFYGEVFSASVGGFFSIWLRQSGLPADAELVVAADAAYSQRVCSQAMLDAVDNTWLVCNVLATGNSVYWKVSGSGAFSGQIKARDQGSVLSAPFYINTVLETELAPYGLLTDSAYQRYTVLVSRASGNFASSKLYLANQYSLPGDETNLLCFNDRPPPYGLEARVACAAVVSPGLQSLYLGFSDYDFRVGLLDYEVQVRMAFAAYESEGSVQSPMDISAKTGAANPYQVAFTGNYGPQQSYYQVKDLPANGTCYRLQFSVDAGGFTNDGSPPLRNALNINFGGVNGNLCSYNIQELDNYYSCELYSRYGQDIDTLNINVDGTYTHYYTGASYHFDISADGSCTLP